MSFAKRFIGGENGSDARLLGQPRAHVAGTPGARNDVTLGQLQGRPELSKQLLLLERLRDALSLSTSCLGAAVGGSLATDRADSMSDVDLVVYCSTGHAETLLVELSAVAQTLPVVYRLKGRHDAQSVFEKVVLEDWSSYEIHVIEPSTRMRLKRPFLEIVNRASYLDTRVSEDKAIGRETVRPFSNGEDGLFWELFNLYEMAPEGRVWLCKRVSSALGKCTR